MEAALIHANGRTDGHDEGIARSEPDGTRRRTGGEVTGERCEWSG